MDEPDIVTLHGSAVAGPPSPLAPRSRGNGSLRCLGAVATALWNLVPVSEAQAQSAAFILDCQKWIDQKGYSTDYVEQRTGKRQPGLAGSWRGNVAVKEVQPGDVVLIRLAHPGAKHAAMVEEVRRAADGVVTAIRLSESNWGRMTHPRCLITENFGRVVADRWIEAASVADVWRPSLPLP